MSEAIRVPGLLQKIENGKQSIITINKHKHNTE